MLNKLINKIKTLGFKSILMMHLGLLCCAVSTVIFLTPSRMVVSGATGLALFIGIITNLQEHYYIFLYAINAVLLIIAFFTLGKEFTLKTIYGALMLPTFGMIITEAINLFNIDLIEVVGNVEPVFVVLFASILMGTGIGLNMKNGGSTGGFDIIEAILFKYFNIPYSTSIYTLDAILVILGMLTYDASLPHSLFANSFSEGLGAVVYIFVLGFIVDTITFGGYNKRAVFIRSSKYEEIHDAIIHKLVRGVTYLNAEGGYSQDKTKVILCICYSNEYFKLRAMVQEIDPVAFMFVMKSTEVRGLGFNFETPEHIERHKKKRAS